MAVSYFILVILLVQLSGIAPYPSNVSTTQPSYPSSSTSVTISTSTGSSSCVATRKRPIQFVLDLNCSSVNMTDHSSVSDALRAVFGNKMTFNLCALDITSLSCGSVVVDFEIVIEDSVGSALQLTQAIVALLVGSDFVNISGIHVGVTSASSDGTTLTSESASDSSAACDFYTVFSGDCSVGTACTKLDNGVFTCVIIAKDSDYEAVTTGLGATTGVLSLIMTSIGTGVGIYLCDQKRIGRLPWKRKKKNAAKKKKEEDEEKMKIADGASAVPVQLSPLKGASAVPDQLSPLKGASAVPDQLSPLKGASAVPDQLSPLKVPGASAVPDQLPPLKGEIETPAKYEKNVYVRSINDKDTPYISGIVVLPGDYLMLADRCNDKVKLFNLKLNALVAELKLPRVIWGITKVKETMVAVTDDIKQTIIFVNVDVGVKTNKQILKIDRIVKVDGQCRGIASIGDNLVVSCDNPARVKMINSKGKIIKDNLTQEITKDDLTQDKMVDKSLIVLAQDINRKIFWSIAVSYNNTMIYIEDWYKGTVTMVDKDGDHKKTSCTKMSICGLTVDESDNVYVCDRASNNVLRLTKDLKNDRKLLKKSGDVDSPRSIKYWEHKLYVGMHSSNFVKVFQMTK